MILGALVDAGLNLDELRQVLSGLAIRDEFSISAEPVHRGALRATLVHVETYNHQPENHSHHRHLSDIAALLENSDLSESVRAKSVQIFRRLAEAEGSVHGMPPEKVHFHEVGAVDAIVDIVGAVWGLERLGATELFSSALPMGGGSVSSSHGTLPLPAPAVLALLASVGAPIRPWQTDKELVTPTGAAILTSLATFSQPAMRLERVGVGAGMRDLPWPNVLRLWLGNPSAAGLSAHNSLSVLETNIDNMNPEMIGHVMQRLFEAGALDVYLTPIFMKKNRPGTMLSVIARPQDEAALAEMLLRETSTLGVRVQHDQRYEVEREVRLVETPYGDLQVKLKWLDGRVASVSPEFESCRQAAAESGALLMDVYRAVEQAATRLVGTSGFQIEKDAGHD